MQHRNFLKAIRNFARVGCNKERVHVTQIVVMSFTHARSRGGKTVLLFRVIFVSR